MHLRRPLIALGWLVLASCAVSCGTMGGEVVPAPTVTVTQTVTAPPAAATSATPSRTSEAPTDGRLKMGSKFKGEQVDITVLDFDRKVKSGIDEVPYMEAALVKTCVTDTDEPLELGWSPWEMTNADGERYEDSGWSPLDKKPLYPNGERTYDKGECAKGWILFESYKKDTDTVRYENEDGDVARWKVS